MDRNRSVGEIVLSLSSELIKKIGPTVYKTRTQIFKPYKHLTASQRALPNFIILGAMRAGTTGLSYYLYEHPETFLSIPKEVHFFDGGKNPQIDTFAKGTNWYRTHFPLKSKINAQTKVYEATPIYLFNPLVPKRIYEALPNVKLIVLLRNPTVRAVSHYLHGARRNWDPLPFYEALQAEEARLKPVIEAGDYKNRTFIEYSYKSRGLYRQQIERYLEYFSKEQMLILNSSDLFTKTEATVKRVFEFIGVDPTYKVNNLTSPNPTPNKRKFESRIYEYLDDYFKPHNEALYELVGEDYGWNS